MVLACEMVPKLSSVCLSRCTSVVDYRSLVTLPQFLLLVIQLHMCIQRKCDRSFYRLVNGCFPSSRSQGPAVDIACVRDQGAGVGTHSVRPGGISPVDTRLKQRSRWVMPWRWRECRVSDSR